MLRAFLVLCVEAEFNADERRESFGSVAMFSLGFRLLHEAREFNSGSALVAGQNQFYEFIILDFCLYDLVGFVCLIIWGYHGSTFGAWKSSISVYPRQINRVEDLAFH